MSDHVQFEEPPFEEESEGRSRLTQILMWIGFGLASLALLAAALVAVLDTGPGRRFISDQIERLSPQSGLKIAIGRIEGSIYGKMTLRNVRLSDPKGVFAESPAVSVDWRPAAWLANRLQINTLSSSLIKLHRLPELRPSEDQGPILPGFDIRVGALDVDRLVLGDALTGSGERVATLSGKADIRSGRAMIEAAARMRDGGDRLALILDAEPDRDRFDLEAAVSAPEKGVIATLGGFERPLEMRISGDGTWRKWQGVATAQSEDLSLLDLKLAMSGGQFELTGNATPGAILDGPVAALTAPRLDITSTATLRDRQLDLTTSLRSSALHLDTNGLLNLAKSRFEGMAVNLALLKPEAITPDLKGRDIRLRATVAGPFSGPTVDYAVTTPFIAYGDTQVQDVRLSGRANLEGVEKRIPVSLTATRVTGIGDEAERIVANLRMDGALLLKENKIVSDGLAFRSDRLNGRLGLVYDMASGRYTAVADAKLDRYAMAGLGVVDVQSRLTLTPAKSGGVALSGTAKALARKIENSVIEGLTGVGPIMETGLSYGPDGIFRFNNMRLKGPDAQLAGQGMRRANGTFLFDIKGRQTTYGNLDLKVDGALPHPTVVLHLPRPHIGANLSNVAVRLDPEGQGWRFTANGHSVLGPFDGKGRIAMPDGRPMSIDIAPLNIAQSSIRGTLVSRTGGMDGSLALTGGGINGTIVLTPVNNVQKITAQIDVRRARFPGPPSIFIGQGKINAVAMLNPEGPVINASVNANRLRYGQSVLNQLSASADMKNGSGTVGVKLVGNANVPFSFAAQAAFSPTQITLNGNGLLEGKPVRFTQPAIISREGDDWALRRATLEFAGGSAQLSGRWGAETALDARLNDIGLSLLNLINPELGLSGRASGTLSYNQPAKGQLPKGRVALTIKGLNRAGLAAATPASFDLGVAAMLDGRAGALRAVIRSKNEVVGRIQGRLAPIPGDASDPLTERLFAAPLKAQIRYNGPLEALWRLSGVEALDISGPGAVAADIGGRLGEPTIRGVFRTTAARVESPIIGAVVNQIVAEGRFNGSRLVIPEFTGATPKAGTLSGRAMVELSPETGFGMDVSINADKARLINRDDLRADVSGPIRLRSDKDGGVISGDVKVDAARFRIGRTAAAEVPRLEVREINRAGVEMDDEEATRPWKLDIKANGRNQLMVTGMGLDSEWRADVQVGGTTEAMDIVGTANLVRGAYEFAGKRFELTRGQIRFTGGYPPDPTVDIVAEAKVQGLSATIRVGGTGLRPEVSFASIPALPEDEVLSRLLFGTSIANLSAPEAIQLAAAAASLRSGGSSAGNPLNKIGRAIGVDRIRVLPGDESTGQGASVAAGKYIGKRVYVELASDAQGYSATQIEVELTRWLSLLSKVSTLGETSVNVKVSKDY